MIVYSGKSKILTFNPDISLGWQENCKVQKQDFFDRNYRIIRILKDDRGNIMRISPENHVDPAKNDFAVLLI